MHKTGIALVVWLFVFNCYFTLVAFSGPWLPETVASHFNGAGQADGWMSKSGYLWSVSGLGLLLPVLIVGLTYVTRFCPDWMINLPNKGYWLGPGQRREAFAWLTAHSVWLASLVLGLFAATHCLTIKANQRVPASLPNTALFILMGIFLVGMGFWTISLIRHFRRPL